MGGQSRASTLGAGLSGSCILCSNIITQRTSIPKMTTRRPDPQNQSSFITCLPFEVRERIYLELWRSCGLRQHIIWHRNKDDKTKSHFCRWRCTTPFSVEDKLQGTIEVTRIEVGASLGDSLCSKTYALQLFSAWKNHFACGQRIVKVYGRDADPGIRTCSSQGPCWSSHKSSSENLSTCSPYFSMLLSCKIMLEPGPQLYAYSLFTNYCCQLLRMPRVDL
jgi:hypothetical protein